MPKISIFEKDLTTAGYSEDNNNVAYIPGYAIMGPVNEPTLCSSLEEFQSIFGSKPYIFKRAQAQPRHMAYVDGTYAFAGDYEKSYIYAAELLNNGLPVLFERYMPESKVTDKWIASISIPFAGFNDVQPEFKLVAKNPGSYGTHISYKFNNPVAEITKEDMTVVNGNFELINQWNDDEQAYDVVDTSTIEDFTNWYEVLEDNTIIAYEEQMRADSKATRIFVTRLSDTKSILRAGSIIGDRVETDDIYVETNTKVLADSIITVNSNLSVLIQKEDGKYSFESLVFNGDKNNIYNLQLTLVSDVEYGIKKSTSEEFNISFNPSNDNYYANITSKLVDIELDLKEKSLDEIYALAFNSLGENKVLREGYLELPLVNRNPETNAIIEDEFEISDLYSAMLGRNRAGDVNVSIFDKLTDKGEYQIKFITSGSYPTFEYGQRTTSTGRVIKDAEGRTLPEVMMYVASVRGDCIALIDHSTANRPLVGDLSNSLITSVNKLFENPIDVGTETKREDARKYGAMFTPWAMYRSKVLNVTSTLPASFGYLISLSESIKTNENWYAVAGVTRGLVPNFIQPLYNVTGAEAEALQPEKGISVNPIINIKRYGYCIWGNRTLNENKEGLVASSFLNIRALSNDVKKVVYTAAKKLTFELNSDILWLNFRSEIEPLLDKMVSGNGLSGYKVLRKATNKRATVEAVIKLYAIEAVEDWDIDIELSDNYVSIQ